MRRGAGIRGENILEKRVVPTGCLITYLCVRCSCGLNGPDLAMNAQSQREFWGQIKCTTRRTVNFAAKQASKAEPNDVLEHGVYLGILTNNNNKIVKQETAFINTIAITTWWEIGLQGRQWELFLFKESLLWILVFLYKSFPFGLGFYFQTPRIHRLDSQIASTKEILRDYLVPPCHFLAKVTKAQRGLINFLRTHS